MPEVYSCSTTSSYVDSRPGSSSLAAASQPSKSSPVRTTRDSPGASASIAGTAASNAGPTTITVARASWTMRAISPGVSR